MDNSASWASLKIDFDGHTLNHSKVIRTPSTRPPCYNYHVSPGGQAQLSPQSTALLLLLLYPRKMIDRVFILIKSGNGGDGAISGRHEKYVPRGGPDGGNGGDGGSVYLLSDSNVNTLLEYRYKKHHTASPGGMGQGALKHGRNGKDITLTVPVGTQVWVGKDSSQLLADLDTPGEPLLVAKGGRGGAGNARYASSTNQFPMRRPESLESTWSCG